MISFPVIGSIDRIHASCIIKKTKLIDSHIIYPNGKIKVTIDTKTTFTLIEGDPLLFETLVRDIAVLALDEIYYPVTKEEWN